MTTIYPTAPGDGPVDDRFRALEDPADPRTIDWVGRQATLAEEALSAVPQRQAIRTRVAELWDHPRCGVPFERGGRWFQMRNSGLQPQPVLWVSDRPGGGGRVLLDPNELSPDGTVSLSGLDVTDDGGLVAYATSLAGSDWRTWRVREVATGRDRPDVVEWSKYSGAAWRPDGSGFYYTSVARPAAGAELTEEVRSARVCFHPLGAERDDVVFDAAEHPDWIPTAEVTDSGDLVVTAQAGTGTETAVFVSGPTEDLRPLSPPLEARDEVIGSDAGGFVVLTERHAPRGRVVRAEPGLDPDLWQEMVPETADTLASAHLFGGHLVCHYLRDARSVLRVSATDGTAVREVTLPGPVSVAGLEGRQGSPLFHFQVVSFVQSGAIWSHDVTTGDTTEVSPSAAPIDPGRFVTEQVFVRSADGTDVPMFVTRPLGLRPDGQARVLLYGYGGFAVALTPVFSVTFAAWLDRGGVLAVANLRGGGEYGRPWHDAGRLGRKQNVFDDFAACASWLVTSGWSQPARIALNGGSNGGLLVGASLTQHPEMFGAAVAEVGVFDMLRFHLFTIGWAWKSDYGDPDDRAQREVLRSYSPLHNVRPGACYPATLLMTGDHDDRVVPAHSYKFAAALQEAQSCGRPVLLRVSTSAGHGAGKPTGKLIDEAADKLAFLEFSLGAAGRPT